MVPKKKFTVKIERQFYVSETNVRGTTVNELSYPSCRRIAIHTRQVLSDNSWISLAHLEATNGDLDV